MTRDSLGRLSRAKVQARLVTPHEFKTYRSTCTPVSNGNIGGRPHQGAMHGSPGWSAQKDVHLFQEPVIPCPISPNGFERFGELPGSLKSAAPSLYVDYGCSEAPCSLISQQTSQLRMGTRICIEQANSISTLCGLVNDLQKNGFSSEQTLLSRGLPREEDTNDDKRQSGNEDRGDKRPLPWHLKEREDRHDGSHRAKKCGNQIQERFSLSVDRLFQQLEDVIGPDRNILHCSEHIVVSEAIIGHGRCIRSACEKSCALELSLRLWQTPGIDTGRRDMIQGGGSIGWGFGLGLFGSSSFSIGAPLDRSDYSV